MTAAADEGTAAHLALQEMDFSKLEARLLGQMVGEEYHLYDFQVRGGKTISCTYKGAHTEWEVRHGLNYRFGVDALLEMVRLYRSLPAPAGTKPPAPVLAHAPQPRAKAQWKREQR